MKTNSATAEPGDAFADALITATLKTDPRITFSGTDTIAKAGEGRWTYLGGHQPSFQLTNRHFLSFVKCCAENGIQRGLISVA